MATVPHSRRPRITLDPADLDRIRAALVETGIL